MNEVFYSKSLQNTHSKIEKSISNHLQKLDRVSNDIKQLEEILAQAALSVDYEYLFDRSFKDGPCANTASGENIVIHYRTDHLLIWNTERKRLMYEIHVTPFLVQDVDMSDPLDKKQITTSKPLIECRAHIRLKIEPELDFFFQGLDTLLGQGFLEETVKITSPRLLAKKNFLEDETIF